MNYLTDKISILTGKAGAVASVALLVLVMGDVILRFVFSVSFNWLTESEWHFFGFIFLLGASYNVWADKHVRVDFYYEAFSEKSKHLVNLILHILFLIPWALISIHTCYQYASNSFYIRESSPNPGGLPLLYPIKYVVVLCFVLLLLQGLTEVRKEAEKLRDSWKS